MKANELLEKIYIRPMPNISDGYVGIALDEPHKTMIEYTRTDAFIEKACDAYCRLCDTKECGDTGECDWIEKFRKRLMK